MPAVGRPWPSEDNDDDDDDEEEEDDDDHDDGEQTCIRQSQAKKSQHWQRAKQCACNTHNVKMHRMMNFDISQYIWNISQLNFSSSNLAH